MGNVTLKIWNNYLPKMSKPEFIRKIPETETVLKSQRQIIFKNSSRQIPLFKDFWWIMFNRKTQKYSKTMLRQAKNQNAKWAQNRNSHAKTQESYDYAI